MQYACKASDCPDLSKSNLYNNNLIHDNMHFTFLFCKAGVPNITCRKQIQKQKQAEKSEQTK